MRHHAFAAAMGVLTAVVFVPASQASAADPLGYWVKPDSERNAKIQITKCGKGGAQLCASIVWLENPNDNRGKPLHDIRNENPSMRDRPIEGLPLFTGMARTGPSTWTGKIYNPEDGNTYSATLTMVSHKQIILKGCKAWLLCGERMWFRTSPPPQPKTEEPLIEAKAEPEAAQPAQPAQAAAASMPSAAVAATAREAEPVLNDVVEAAPEVELVSRAAPPSEHAARPGYGFLSVSTHDASSDELSGENVPSMFTMADPLEADELAPQTTAASAPAPMPAAKPKAPAAPQAAAPQATAATQPAQPPAAQGEAANGQQAALAESAETTEGMQTYEVIQPPMTRRERRSLRRQQRQLLPWLQ